MAIALQPKRRNPPVVAEDQKPVRRSGLLQQPDVLCNNGKLGGREPLTSDKREVLRVTDDVAIRGHQMDWIKGPGSNISLERLAQAERLYVLFCKKCPQHRRYKMAGGDLLLNNQFNQVSAVPMAPWVGHNQPCSHRCRAE